MRIVKEAEVRKNEILDAASALFAEKGFDNTSTNDILEAVGIARGTLYHHFKSKEAIMDALIERQTGKIMEGARRIASNSSIPVEARIIGTIMALKVEQTEGAGGREMIEHLHNPQNALMHQKTKQIIMQKVPPILASVIQDGIDEGLYNTPYPLECMEMAVAYLETMFDEHVIEMTEEESSRRIEAFLFHLERILGVETGSLTALTMLFGKDGE